MYISMLHLERVKVSLMPTIAAHCLNYPKKTHTYIISFKTTKTGFLKNLQKTDYHFTTSSINWQKQVFSCQNKAKKN
jgi:hypothetical protein